jgi:sugar/nucleoside kinase (ribokinase family)
LYLFSQLNGSTFSASNVKTSAGGVGRNIADGLSKLGHEVLFISAIGQDDKSEIVIKSLPKVVGYIHNLSEEIRRNVFVLSHAHNSL